MPARILCPNCHSPVEAHRFETAANAAAEYRVCPECDLPVVLSLKTDARPAEELALATEVDWPPLSEESGADAVFRQEGEELGL
ncbi:hypothetical protein [Propionivibrio soli]|uniref:hypothetical protein n=1 Tax=Propionivibrio soli TaxID=2976531 RepID=UPI0021E83948|nr:hypothetical protein [Propionivibrio soli]